MTARVARVAPFRVVAMLVILASVASPSRRLDAAAQQSEPDAKITTLLQQGEQALRARAFDRALDAFKRASQLPDKPSPVALYGVARAYHGLKDYKKEAEVCASALKDAPGDGSLAALLHNQRGVALMALAGKNVEKIKDAEAEFRAAVADRGSPPIAWFDLGVALLKESQDDEGKRALETYLDLARGVTTETELAEGLIENPRRAREPLAPAFSFTTHTGETVKLADLAGKTVLLDFWGTWCGPCRAATPMLVSINKRHANQAFAMVSISSDAPSDRQVWQKYIEVNKMNWLNSLDADRRVHGLFDVHVFPTYIVIDGDGMIRDRIEGYGLATGNELDGLVNKSLKAGARK
jgi:thiol-disulfide isomerase/thioredoxin